VIIDSHLHIWDLERAEYAWLNPSLCPINRTINFYEIAPTLAASGIQGCVLVEADDNAEDTDIMLDAASRHPEVLAVVAWAPLDRPDELPARLEQLAQHSVVRGVRNLFQSHPREWAVSPEVDHGIGMLAAARLPLDFVTNDPAPLAELPGMLERHPDLSLVIDHLGKPPIGGTAEQRSEWRELLAAVARDPRVYAKVSGLYSSVGEMADWTTAAVKPFFDDALELFGADRLMYGGDWPVSILAGGYGRTWDAITELAETLSPSERDALLGGTAQNFYRIATEDPPLRNSSHV
jgi:L-fuconolactonase